MTDLSVPVEGMTCGGCVKSVTRALEQTAGVEVVEVTLAPPRARVRLDASRANRADVVRAIEDAGFDVPTSAAEH